MARAFIAIGSNIDPETNVKNAVRLLAEHATITQISTVYRTLPLERPEQAPFYNCVVEIQTALSPRELKFQALRSIEAQINRQRTSDKYAPRTIDLDLILYEGLVLDESDLVLPDPEISRRFFLAIPLAELDPDLIIPGSDMFISDLAALLYQEEARPLLSFTAQIKEEILR